MISNDEQEAKALATYLASEQPNKRFLVVFGEFFYRRAIAKMVDAALSPEQKKFARLDSLPLSPAPMTAWPTGCKRTHPT